MKKLFYSTLVFISFILITSCGQDNSSEKIKKKISQYKSDIQEISFKIAELEKKLSSDSLRGYNDHKTLVSILEIKNEKFKHSIEVNGNVEAVNKAFISAELSGQIKSVNVNEGEKVIKGQLLILLSTAIIQKSIDETEEQLNLVTVMHNKQKELWDKKIGSEVQYLQAKTNKDALEKKLITMKAQLDMSYIKAPFDGIVETVYHKEGEIAVPGMQLIELVNLSELYVTADVSESYLTVVNVGDSVIAEFPSYPDVKIKLPIYRTGNIINTQNRTFKVQLKFQNKYDLKPNILSVININDFTVDTAIVIPSIIIKQDITGQFVFTAIGEADNIIAKKQYIKTGKSYDNKTMVLQGLTVGHRIITAGYNMISNGTEISIK